MILELFVVLVAIALIFIGLGLYADDLKAFSIIGCLFLFLLGVYIILPNQLEIKSGSTITDLGGGVTSNVYNYVPYNDVTTHYVGYFLSIVAFLSVFLIPIMKKNTEEE
jgi:hypothetical protein